MQVDFINNLDSFSQNHYETSMSGDVWCILWVSSNFVCYLKNKQTNNNWIVLYLSLLGFCSPEFAGWHSLICYDHIFVKKSWLVLMTWSRWIVFFWFCFHLIISRKYICLTDGNRIKRRHCSSSWSHHEMAIKPEITL